MTIFSRFKYVLDVWYVGECDMVQYVESGFELMLPPFFDGIEVLKIIERAGRISYKSEGNITEDSWRKFLTDRLSHKPPHLTVIEHGYITVKIICDRGISHELVRHRLCSFTQESTRFCNYGKDKFGREITVIDKSKFFNTVHVAAAWRAAMVAAEDQYMDLIDKKHPAEIARGVLPNDLKTEIVISTNLREWGHIFFQRTSEAAHPCMKEIMIPLHQKFQEMFPIIYDDLSVYC